MTQEAEWKANRAKWVAALRDPSRKQVAGRLGHQSTGGQCCLGVLAEVAGCTHEQRRSDNGDHVWDGCVDVAPGRAMGFVGLHDEVGSYGKTTLAVNNDECGMSFAQIADVIESEPPGLFR